MSVTADPGFMKELKEFGQNDAKKCYHCGNCTATCPLSTNDHAFPRRFMRYAQLGMKEKILTSPEPWLCYYCGECSTRCPRGADPGETMMVMRRYLTSLYDWTGFARRFYTSEKFEIAAVSVVAVLVGLALLIFRAGPFITDRIAINAVWPAHVIEIADLVMAAVLSTLLLSNVWRCFRIVMGEDRKSVPLRIYLQEAKNLVIHFLTQKQFGKCSDRMQWLVHLLIMTGYSSVFLLVVVFIRWFQRDEEVYNFFHPIRLVGYYATFAILYGATYALIGRLRKSKPQYKNSHGTDWMFLVLLILTTLTGILIHFTRLLNWPISTYTIYIIHMMVAIPMLVLEVPFAKWAHLAYRPVVLFALGVKERLRKEREAEAA